MPATCELSRPGHIRVPYIWKNSKEAPVAHVAATALRERLGKALAARDRATAVSEALSAVHDGSISIDDLYTDVLTPLLVNTGESWQEGATRVWEEHFATAIVRTIVESLYVDIIAAANEAPHLGRVAVLACPPEEAHDLGLRMLADRMLLVGWDVYFLGADTPVDEIVSAAVSLRAELVALSAATHYNRLLLREVIQALRRELPGVRVGVGGPAFASDRDWPTADLLTEADLGLDPGATSTDG